MERHLKSIFGLIALIAIAHSVKGQPAIARDTSFTVYSTYIKEKKKRPYIEIVEPVKDANVKSKVNIVCNSINGRDLLADIFYPSKRSFKARPAVVMIFGGGWRSGDKSQNIPIAQKLAANGYVAL